MLYNKLKRKYSTAAVSFCCLLPGYITLCCCTMFLLTNAGRTASLNGVFVGLLLPTCNITTVYIHTHHWSTKTSLKPLHAGKAKACILLGSAWRNRAKWLSQQRRRLPAQAVPCRRQQTVTWGSTVVGCTGPHPGRFLGHPRFLRWWQGWLFPSTGQAPAGCHQLEKPLVQPSKLCGL